jgi:cytochrome c
MLHRSKLTGLVMVGLLVAAASAALLATQAGEHQRRFVKSAALTGGDPLRGQVLYRQYGCEACHAMSGQDLPRGKAGPDLTGFSARAYIAGRLRNQPGLLVQWIQAPQSIDPATAMPDLGISQQKARDLAAWLYAAT